MASKQGGTYRNQQRITVDFIGNKTISWVGEKEPSSSSASGHGMPSQSSIDLSSPAQPSDSSQPPSTQSSGTELPDPTSDSELRERFIDYVNKCIEALQVGMDEDTVLHDTSSQFEVLRIRSREDWKTGRNPKNISLSYFERRCDGYQATLSKVQDLWDNRRIKNPDKPVDAVISRPIGKNKATDEGVEIWSMKKQRMEQAQGISEISSDEEVDSVTLPTPPPTVDNQRAIGNNSDDRRTLMEKAVQKVPEWYAGRCVLSNALGAQGAHIVPVKALVKARRNHATYRAYLNMFWSDKGWDNRCSLDEIEKANILPLEAGAHYRWDRFNFAIWPIDHVSDTDPRHLWIQMVWLENTHERGGLVSGSWDHFDGTIGNYRPGIHVMGGKAELTKAAQRNISRLSTMAMSFYSGHRTQKSIAAAGALEDIFRGPPPDDHGNGSFCLSELQKSASWIPGKKSNGVKASGPISMRPKKRKLEEWNGCSPCLGEGVATNKNTRVKVARARARKNGRRSISVIRSHAPRLKSHSNFRYGLLDDPRQNCQDPNLRSWPPNK
ncbi:hypothetical protein B0H67DRAFT_649541 [Lasiosphaeris hirsuta]|uniref:HNH nuclease domain-containing protein n=1 Tax=Lasiosphaeris hirsuta TaxID=260670 RepID=A0AA40DIT8_9PEZI|nr:hypothetical protein B0H67DRAFT_649541 [Lasiosphaeris hirsuta]